MERNTHFAGFAKALLTEMMGKDGYIDFNDWDTEEMARYEQIIAQRAYDLAYHVMSEVSIGIAAENEGGEVPRRENIRYIPDLTELPEVSA